MHIFAVIMEKLVTLAIFIVSKNWISILIIAYKHNIFVATNHQILIADIKLAQILALLNSIWFVFVIEIKGMNIFTIKHFIVGFEVPQRKFLSTWTIRFFFLFFLPFSRPFQWLSETRIRESLWETLHQQKAQITRDCFTFHPRNSLAFLWCSTISLLLGVFLLWRSFDINRNCSLVRAL